MKQPYAVLQRHIVTILLIVIVKLAKERVEEMDATVYRHVHQLHMKLNIHMESLII